MKRRLTGYLLLGFCLLGLAAAMASIDTRPLERHIRRLEGQIHPLGSHSFVLHYPGGAVKERYTVTRDSWSDHLYAEDGTPIEEWTLHRKGQFVYEAWYARHKSKERLLEDDRTVSYTSFYRNGQKWEQYTENREKGETSYYVYDEDGHLLNTDI